MTTPGSAPPNHYLLIKRDSAAADGRWLTAQEGVDALLAHGRWPLWHHTRNRARIAAGAHVAIYLAGPGNQTVVATARVRAVEPWRASMRRAYPLALDDVPVAALVLADVRRLPQSVAVRRVFEQVSFLRGASSKKWGVAFMGGVRALSAADFAVLTTAIAAAPGPGVLRAAVGRGYLGRVPAGLGRVYAAQDAVVWPTAVLAERYAHASGVDADFVYAPTPDRIPITAGQRTCRVCGCSATLACPGGCSWLGSDLCSSCV